MARTSEMPRPDPRVMLELAAREGRGKLTVFLGAAPGVGKTYAMLSRAQRLRQDGVDIVVGLVETHGRGETAGLLDGLELLPRKATSVEGAYDEFDLDGALARKPRIIIVDELAHTNLVGSRHPKRYQDIAELVTAGIEVWTALNIQHLESLSDLVARIAGVPVRETVPDIVLKHADEVILVDLPPDELIARLNEGKVYLPDNAQRAREGFFKPATLTALRELALRRAADRVDDQMVDLLRQSATEGPWATGERLLVCVGPDALSEKVVRVASRLASGLNARWTVLSLTRPGGAIVDAQRATQLEETLRLAERLGAEVKRAQAEDFVAEIFRLARRENITQIVLGLPRDQLWARLSRRSLAQAVLRHAGDIGVHFVPGDDGTPRPRRVMRRPKLPHLLLDIAVPLVSVVAITALGLALAAVVALQNLSMLYLAAVVISAVTRGRIAAVVAAALSFVVYNFFFIEPFYTFTIARPYEVFSLAIFVGVALVTGTLAASLREHEATARLQAQRTQALFDFSRKLSGAQGMDNVLAATASQIQSSLGLGAMVLMQEGSELSVEAAWPPDVELDVTAMTAARWAYDKREAAGFRTGTLPQIGYLFRPILSGQRVVGVVGLAMAGRSEPLSAEEDRTLAAMLEQAAIAIDRARLVRENAEAAVVREGEKLQTALLSSLSHDLRTPLASITGAVTSLRQLGDKMSVATRDDLMASIEEEAGRLTRFVSNLFDMTRIEAGGVKARREALDLGNVIEKAVARAKGVHADLAVEISLAADLQKARGDATLLEQTLFNLLDNARKYGGAEHPVAVFARSEGAQVVLSVTDEGKGIPPEDLGRIFEKFYRRAKGDGRAAGTGLGLSIARGFIEAMGGTIKAESPAVRRRGTRFVIRLPIYRDDHKP